MRIHVDFSAFLNSRTPNSPVVQVEKTPAIGPGSQTTMNGKFLLPVPLDNDFPVYGVKRGTFTSAEPDSGVLFNSPTPTGLQSGDIITITGSVNYDGVWAVDNVDLEEGLWFSVSDLNFVGTDAGAWESGDYVVNAAMQVDGYDLASQGMARLLAAYPMFGNVYFNPLLTEDHVSELDFTFEFLDPDTGELFTPRLQTGREAALDDSGQFPTHTALLPLNDAVTPNRPGLLVTQPIPIGPYTLDCNNEEAGTDEFMLWWKLYDFGVTDDVAADYGARAGENSPAQRKVVEVTPEPPDFSAYISTDMGANWCEVGLLEPVAFCNKTKTVMIAFKNTDGQKRFIASFALLF